MKIHLFLYATLATAGLVSCGNSRSKQVEDFRQQKRVEFYDDKLNEAQRELQTTDSLLQRVEAEGDSFDVQQRIYQDSLELQSDVQGAKIRYIHRKQKELQ